VNVNCKRKEAVCVQVQNVPFGDTFKFNERFCMRVEPDRVVCETCGQPYMRVKCEGHDRIICVDIRHGSLITIAPTSLVRLLAGSYEVEYK
jgi:hypothetical protein